MEKAVVFDLDGTLCVLWDTANPYNHDWEEQINYPIYEELEKEWAMLPVTIIILTWRKRKEYWEITEKWLQDNDIPYDILIMQEKSQADKNHIFKKEKLLELQKEYKIMMMYDDNPDVGEVCRELWISFYPVY